MNILDLVTEATKAGEEWSQGKDDHQMREGIETAAWNSHKLWLERSNGGVAIQSSDIEREFWRYTFAIACFR